MRTFSIHTLGCKVNQYESDQIAALLRGRGWEQVDQAGVLRIVNTCSVTVEAAAKSRQISRRAGRVSLPVLSPQAEGESASDASGFVTEGTGRPRVLVTGCWATSDRDAALKLPGVDAVITHHDDVAAELHRFLDKFEAEGDSGAGTENREHTGLREFLPSRDEFTEAGEQVDPVERLKPLPSPRKGNEGWNEISVACDVGGTGPQDELTGPTKAISSGTVNGNSFGFFTTKRPQPSVKSGTIALPLLGQRRATHQRAFLKVQDGCDAHCTYCIIPQLRPALWSKPIDDVVAEARALVDAGHVELVLTGIFLGAYGQPTALRRRQRSTGVSPVISLIESLCTRVPGLKRLRLSSLEPGDLNAELLAVLRSHPQITPHFHLPLQSGSDRILRRMNRQYGRDDFVRMIDAVRGAFDRPAFTTDVIVGFPGETGSEFEQTLDVVDHAAFIHVHAFPFSPRPGTAAARWRRDFVSAPIGRQRIALLGARAEQHSLRFRRQFVGEVAEVLVERHDGRTTERHGRCERYFDIAFEGPDAMPGDAIRVRVMDVTTTATRGEAI